jgi:hypothetical protein
LKTKIITLESHDDLISVRDKLSWAKTPRILLVWPKYARVTLRILDLKVLQRHADSLGAQLGLVTRRMKVRRDAESLGIPVFKSSSEAQRKEWTQPAPREQRIPAAPRRDLRAMREIAYPKESAWRTSLPGRVITFTLGVFAVLILAAAFIPRAELILHPATQTQSAVIPISASESNQAVFITGMIPARTLSVDVEMQQTLAITSVIPIPKSKAQGVARFTNLAQKEINIPKGTVVMTSDEPQVRFVTLTNTLFGVGSKFLDVRVEAEKAGASGNVPAGAINTVEGGLGLSLAVSNPGATTGGADVEEIGATDTDREKLRDSTLENLRREAETKMRAQIPADDFLLMDTFELANIADETFDPAIGQPGKSLSLTMRADFSARYISAADLNQLAQVTLGAVVPAGFDPLGMATFKLLGEPHTDVTGVTHFEIEASRVLIQKMDTLQVFPIVRGRDPQTVKDELTKKLSLRQSPEITLTPAWWKWMPLIPFNVKVEVQ